MQITRQRVRPEMNIVTSEVCPACNGTGTIRPTILLMDDIENNFNYILDEQNEKILRFVFTLILKHTLKKDYFPPVEMVL